MLLPIVVAEMPTGVELGERSSRKRQFLFAKDVIKKLQSTGINNLRGLICAGLFVFFDAQQNFRLSLVSTSVNAETGKLEFNSFRRQSFFVPKGVKDEPSNRTFYDRLSLPANSLAELHEIFSVETLTEDFYKEIEKWFLHAKDTVRFPGSEILEKESANADDAFSKHQSNMTLRLITRLIFVWFLKAKKLVPAELFDKKAIDKLLNYKDSTGSTYYKAILQNLFFATLNVKISERDWVNRQTGNQDYFRYKRFFKSDKNAEYIFDICGKVPFVNGGLFENLDIKNDNGSTTYIDCFSNQKANEPLLCVPDALFFGENGILPILQRYNFTIEENAPTDEDVSLDPELLGRVFENLLAFVNPETSEQARKSSGSFYTPREIVNYMVNESLVAYLCEKCGNAHAETIQNLVRSDETHVPAALASKIANALDHLKLLDPACGSGAFPMGALIKILELYEKIGVVNSDDAQAVHAKKLSIIQNSIYGVDIQNIAVQISKLRFFISLLCEQKTNDDQAQNYGVSVLPNLESKLVCANTLIALPQTIEIENENSDELALNDVPVQAELALGETSEIRTIWENLREDRQRYFSAKDKAEKRQLKKNDEKNREDLRKKLLANAGTLPPDFAKSVELIAAWSPYKTGVSAPFFDPVWMFGFEQKNDFDIVIGNPPYIKEKNNKDAFKNLKGLPYYQGKMDIWFFFACLGLDFLKQGGLLSFIAQNQWYTSAGASIMREKIRTEGRVLRINDFNDYKAFESADTQTMTLLIRKENNADSYKFIYRKIIAKNPKKQELLECLDLVQSKNILHQENVYLREKMKGKTFVFNVGLDAQILEKIETKSNFEFSEKEIGQGIIGSPDNAFKFVDSDYKLTNEEHKIAKQFHTFTSKYFSAPINKYIFYSSKDSVVNFDEKKYPNFYENMKPYIPGLKKTRSDTPGIKWFHLWRWRDNNFFSQGAKLVWTKRSSGQCFTYTEEEFYGTANLFFIKTNRVNLKYLTGYLNSSLCQFSMEKLLKHNGLLLQIDKVQFREIPLYIPSQNEQAPIIALVDKILAAKAADFNADTSAWEREIDRLVYALYSLTDEEIAIVEAVPAGTSAAGTPKSSSKSGASKRGKPKASSGDIDGEIEF